MIERKVYPPNYPEIIARFPKVAAQAVIFAYDGVIYNPTGAHISRALEVHEKMHLVRQSDHSGGAEGWWSAYLRDRPFRLFEEVVAHRVEVLHMLTKTETNRAGRRGAMKQVARKLANPMYDFGLSNQQSLKLLRDNPS